MTRPCFLRGAGLPNSSCDLRREDKRRFKTPNPKPVKPQIAIPGPGSSYSAAPGKAWLRTLRTAMLGRTQGPVPNAFGQFGEPYMFTTIWDEVGSGRYNLHWVRALGAGCRALWSLRERTNQGSLE